MLKETTILTSKANLISLPSCRFMDSAQQAREEANASLHKALTQALAPSGLASPQAAKLQAGLDEIIGRLRAQQEAGAAAAAAAATGAGSQPNTPAKGARSREQVRIDTTIALSSSSLLASDGRGLASLGVSALTAAGHTNIICSIPLPLSCCCPHRTAEPVDAVPEWIIGHRRSVICSVL